MNFEQIYKSFNGKVLRYIRLRIKDQMIAEELASDVMIKIYKKFSTFDEAKSSLATWVFNIAKNTIIDYFRKKVQCTTSLENVYVDWANGEEAVDHLIAIKDTEMNPVEQMIENETTRTMYDKFETLSENEKIVASLHYFDGLSYDEIAEQLAIPLGTIKARLHSARTAMMEALPIEMRK